MRRLLKGGLVLLFVLLIALGGIIIHTVVQSRHYGELVNYVGIVRGATQRLVKLELNNKPDDSIVEYLDGILQELKTGKGGYGLPLPDDENYQEKLFVLDGQWTDIKGLIYAYRDGQNDGNELLVLSEDYFQQANDTVFAAVEYSSRQIHYLLVTCIVMLGNMLLTWLFILWAYVKNLLRLENTNKKLSDIARRDVLTGVYQLNAFKEEAQRLLDAGAKDQTAIVYTDFTDFKYIDDVFGYPYGDSILKQYGKILMAGLRAGELCGRVSADKFVLFLQYTDKDEVVTRQRETDKKILAFMKNSSHHQSVPTCCGICCVEDVVEELNIDGLLDRANFARKTVKNGTNPNYVFYNESIRNRLREEKYVEGRMAEALENREFKVFYQPKVDLKTDKIAASEALVRWQGDNGAIIPPDRFIPVFESKFMIDRLDQYVFEVVCRFLQQRLQDGKQVLPVSVNVSRLQFYEPNFIKRYVEIREKYQVPPELLEIEFTESIATDNAELLTWIVKQLRSAGFSCSIDDFGKGYSSLSLLKTLPVDVVKIDRFFFTDSDDPQRDRAVVQGVVELVHKFGIRTVAEGIESPEQVKYLKKIGCDSIQGYVFYRPMPQEAYSRLLDEET